MLYVRVYYVYMNSGVSIGVSYRNNLKYIFFFLTTAIFINDKMI